MSTNNLNRLSNEKSPYLLQHADNPVDWFPWGEEAFQKAKEDNKLIFLSVGYSTCHWCHVMAHESFENEAIAKIMNDNFVNVKVDREIQPDVDRMYMIFVQSLTGGGGWPMSVFLTPDLYPVFGGTYFPPEDQHGRPGFPSLLKRMASLWKEQGEALKKAGVDTIEKLRELTLQKFEGQNSQLNMKLAHNVHQYFISSFDSDEGGFDGEPKFPTPVQFHFLFRHHYYILSELGKAEERFAIMSIQEIKKRGHSLGIDFKDCDNEAQYLNKLQTVVNSRKQAAKKDLDMVTFTLKKIAMGGIHDHIGNGFHRYSTDKYWHVPHFEKMLYDQAQLLMSYVEVYLLTKDEYYAEVVRDIVTYVERDLRDHEGGGFYSAEDADSYPHEGAKHKLEGAFAVWEASEIKEILGDKNSEIFSYHFGVEPNGNVDPRKDIQGELKKKNVLIERHTPKETAKKFEISLDEVKVILSESKEKLAKYRFDKRPKPHRDDKILTSWNGLLISALARAYDAIRDEKYRELAEGAARFIKDQLYDSGKNRLLRSFREGPGEVEGFVDDYSNLIEGLLDLYQSTFNESYLAWAIDLQDQQITLFYDEEGGGGFYNVGKNNKNILVRLKDDHDGAEPSANSVSVSNLLRLGHIVDKADYNAKAEQTLKYFVERLEKVPYAMPAMAASLMLYLKGIKQIIFVGSEQETIVQKYIDIIRNRFMPNKFLLKAKENGEVLNERCEVIKSILQAESAPSVHICENFTCGMPISDVHELEEKLVES
ncbi:6963_t:CDS:10 [Funneliformis caledonium]|uniref:6963_t:CDS:1 n=1 Tax=Funneliformis caledonium TaxID=1117310 RepID=A0A9N8WMM1_9GLOM|nr:6963_t:CDS:10 [Funneliformis caledonium]